MKLWLVRMILEFNVRGVGPWVCAVHGLEPAEMQPLCGGHLFSVREFVLQPIGRHLCDDDDLILDVSVGL